MPVWFGVPIYLALAGTGATALSLNWLTGGAVVDNVVKPIGGALATGGDYVAQSTANSLGLGWAYSGTKGALTGAYSLASTALANPGFLAGAFASGAAVGLAADYFMPNTNSAMNKSAWLGLTAIVAGVACVAMGNPFAGTMLLSAGVGSLSANLVSANQVSRATSDLSERLGRIEKAVSPGGMSAPAPS